MLSIRLARPDDAQAIHLILQEVWGDSLLFDVFSDHISSPEHQIFVAVDTGEIAGFLSAFLAPKQTSRWEMDIIIVHPKSQGKGIGTSLIQEALTYGANLGACCTKASIRVGNYASQRAFSKAGFTTDDQVFSLLLWDPLACESVTNVVEDVRLMPVDALTYRGLWIDGFVESQLSVKEQHNVIRAAQNRIFHENRLNTSMFIPDSLKQTIAPDLLASATDYGRFHHWHYKFK
jgi:ribosomal protein S18 acetylase RimI-like enzyme